MLQLLTTAHCHAITPIHLLFGSISPNFLRQAKSYQRTVLIKKNLLFSSTNFETNEFRQTTVLNFAKFCSPFAKYVRSLPNAVCKDMLLILFSRKICKHMLMKSTPRARGVELQKSGSIKRGAKEL